MTSTGPSESCCCIQSVSDRAVVEFITDDDGKNAAVYYFSFVGDAQPQTESSHPAEVMHLVYSRVRLCPQQFYIYTVYLHKAQAVEGKKTIIIIIIVIIFFNQKHSFIIFALIGNLHFACCCN